MKISFVIPAYNEENHIGNCLDAIFRELNSSECDAEIIVVNNASTDKTKETVSSYKDVSVIDENKKGIVWARRAGFLASGGDLIANVDADTMLTKGWVDTVTKEFSEDENLVALSGPFMYYDLPRKTSVLVKFFYYAGYFIYLINRYIFRSSGMLQGGNYVVRREALQKIGGYNTNIDFYGEDTDIAKRISEVDKVKFTFHLPMHASGRRLAAEGTFTMGLRYTLNYFWIVLFKKPFSPKSLDIRTDGGSFPGPSKAKELTIAFSAVLIFLSITAGILFGAYKVIQSSGDINAVSFVSQKAEARKIGDKINELSNKLTKELKNNIKR